MVKHVAWALAIALGPILTSTVTAQIQTERMTYAQAVRDALRPFVQVSADEADPNDTSMQGADEEEDSAASDESQDQASQDGGGTSSSQRRSRFNSQTVARGRAAFENGCTTCHDAERSLSKRKSLGGWLATVRRMSRMDDAEINASDIVPIATYLASLSEPAAADAGGAMGGDAGTTSDDAADDGDLGDEASGALDLLTQSTSFSGTISTIWRNGNDNLENPNFFADVWLQADWQPEGPLRGRVTACTSCHADQTGGGGFTFELVEATAHYDLMHWLRTEHCEPIIGLEVGAGRLNVPFGAFSGMSHPGSYRTVTSPLMYNMGRQVNANASRPPVLPMPYSDEGFEISAKLPIWDDVTLNLDSYVVNGLQGFGPGVQFTPSRSYTDNNHEVGVGGRATLGNRTLRVGGSVMSGRMQDEGAPELNYHLSGADVIFRFEDLARFYFEYALRRNDSDFGSRQLSYGTVYELELFVCSDPNIHFLVRYDTLEHRDTFGDESIDRITAGINTQLPGGSLLIVNHEHWDFDAPEPSVDVVGVRWVATF